MGENTGDHPGENTAGTATHRGSEHRRDHTGASRYSANPDPSRRTNPREGTTQKDATSKDQPGRRLATENEAEKPHQEDPDEGSQEKREKELKPEMSWSIPVSSRSNH